LRQRHPDRVDRNDFDQWLARLGDNEMFALRRHVDQPGTLGLGFVEIDIRIGLFSN
jgi:hypothetical protein